MKKHWFFCLLLVGGITPIFGAGSTLQDCYTTALRHNETLKNIQEDIVQADARGRGALGGIFPRLSWDWKDTHQDVDNGNTAFGGLLEENQVESKFSLEQPLFSGLREFSARAGFQKEQARDQSRLQRFERDLYRQTAEAFYGALKWETALRTTETTLQLAEERVRELQSFQRLGKSRESEVASAESQVAQLKAERVRVRGQIRAAREDLALLIGQDLDDQPLQDTPAAVAAPLPLSAYLSRAGQRSDVEAQRRDVEGRRLRVRYEKGAFWPKANVTGNYYTQRPTFFEPVDWDIILSLNVPLYQGGTVRARVRESQSQLRQSQETLRFLERKAAAEIKKAHAQWTASLEQAQALEDAYHAAQRSYDAQKKEYRLGLVTNLDVLQALNTLAADQRAWDDARLDAQLNAVALAIATEARP
jgi:TolC family type I secretion outer membrane protein